jgi:hypothetical protein
MLVQRDDDSKMNAASLRARIEIAVVGVYLT